MASAYLLLPDILGTLNAYEERLQHKPLLPWISHAQSRQVLASGQLAISLPKVLCSWLSSVVQHTDDFLGLAVLSSENFFSLYEHYFVWYQPNQNIW